MIKMTYSNSRNLYIFPHIPRTGGSTIARNLVREFGHNKSFFYLETCKFEQDIAVINRDFEEQKKLRSLHYVIGHLVNESIEYNSERTKWYFTNFREPASWHLSNYNYFMAHSRLDKNTTFWEYFESNPKDYQTGWFYFNFMQKPINISMDLVGKYVLERLKKFDFVCITENLDADYRLLLGDLDFNGVLNKENVSGVEFPKAKSSLTDKERAFVNRECVYDYAIYKNFNSIAYRKKAAFKMRIKSFF